jgi:hypothetical protein
MGPWPEFNSATGAGVKTHSRLVEMPDFAVGNAAGAKALISMAGADNATGSPSDEIRQAADSGDSHLVVGAPHGRTRLTSRSLRHSHHLIFLPGLLRHKALRRIRSLRPSFRQV